MLAAGAVALATLGVGLAISLHPPAAPAPAARAGPQPPPPDPLEVTHWSAAAIAQLASEAETSAGEGLRPDDYAADALARAARAGAAGPEIDAMARTAARRLAHDYAEGRLDPTRFHWFATHPPLTPAALDAALARAVQTGSVQSWLRTLLPGDPRYAALRSALAGTPSDETARIGRLRVAMERWRWMPRDLGRRYILVNVPAERVVLWQEGVAVASYRAVIGKPGTPTPTISAPARSVVVNPVWILPPSVLKEGKIHPGRGGYSLVRENGRTVLRQAPGPTNALGRIKINLPNKWDIYLHDTPAKWAFARGERALSHGCVRVEDVLDLARRIGDPRLIDAALARNATRTLLLPAPLPVYIVYFTAMPDAKGAIIRYPDIYARDHAILAALDAGSDSGSS